LRGAVACSDLYYAITLPKCRILMIKSVKTQSQRFNRTCWCRQVRILESEKILL